jgi:hypothetical protein
MGEVPESFRPSVSCGDFRRSPIVGTGDGCILNQQEFQGFGWFKAPMNPGQRVVYLRGCWWFGSYLLPSSQRILA